MEPQPLQQVDRTYVRYGRGKLSYFAGSDYFRLASHPKVHRAMVDGLRNFGGNVAASRLTTGNHVLYGKVEAALREFFDAPTALVASNGYEPNLVVAQALAPNVTHCLIDSRAHVSLRDAAQLFGRPVIEFQHGDATDAARKVKSVGRQARIILLTDGVFSHNGEIAPLAEYLEILPRNGLILLDDAHGVGVLGELGQGTLEFSGLTRERVIQTITFSKAFGVFGGAVLCSADLREKIVTRSRMLAGSTPPPLSLMNAVLASLHLLRGKSPLRRRLNDKVDYVKAALRRAGFAIPQSPAPIVGIVPRDLRQAEAMRKSLLARKVFPSLIKYPGGPESGYFRFAFSSEHTKEQLDNLAGALEGFDV